MKKNSLSKQRAAAAIPDLTNLSPFIGHWKVSDPSGQGIVHGQVTYEWMEGGFFLIQYVDIPRSGQRIQGIEIVGLPQNEGGHTSENIVSRFYDSTGSIHEYVYALEGNILTIWEGQNGAAPYFQGVFSQDYKSCLGNWHLPDGDVYALMMSRMHPKEDYLRTLKNMMDAMDRTGDFEPMIERLAEEVVFKATIREGIPISGPFVGKQKVTQYFREILPSVAVFVQQKPIRLMADDLQVIMLGEDAFTLKKTIKRIRALMRWWLVFEVASSIAFSLFRISLVFMKPMPEKEKHGK